MNETGPEATPEVEATIELRGLSREKGETGTTTGFVNQGSVLDSLKDFFHRVANMENETCKPKVVQADGRHSSGWESSAHIRD